MDAAAPFDDASLPAAFGEEDLARRVEVMEVKIDFWSSFAAQRPDLIRELEQRIDQRLANCCPHSAGHSDDTGEWDKLRRQQAVVTAGIRNTLGKIEALLRA